MEKEDLRPIGTAFWQEIPVNSRGFELHQDGYQHRFLYRVKGHHQVKECPEDTRESWAEQVDVLKHERRPTKLWNVDGILCVKPDESNPWEEA
jgi:hypothetical protein